MLVTTPDYRWLRMLEYSWRYVHMTPRLVLNYEYYTYRETILMTSFSPLKVGKFVGDVCVNCTPVPPLCPTGRDAPPLPLVKESTV